MTNTFQGSPLATVVAGLPAIVAQFSSAQDSGHQVDAMKAFCDAVQETIDTHGLTQNDVIHSLLGIVAATAVLPEKGMHDDTSLNELGSVLHDYHSFFTVYVSEGKSKTHGTSDTAH